MLFPLEQYAGKLTAQVLINYTTKNTEMSQTLQSALLCIVPLIASLIVVILFATIYKVETPHYYRLARSFRITEPLSVLYKEESRRLEEKDYLDKMYEYGVLKKYALNIKLLINTVGIVVGNNLKYLTQLISNINYLTDRYLANLPKLQEALTS